MDFTTISDRCNNYSFENEKYPLWILFTGFIPYYFSISLLIFHQPNRSPKCSGGLAPVDAPLKRVQ